MMYSNNTKNHREILALYTQILSITNDINKIDITNINLKHDMQLTRDHIIKIIGKFEIQSVTLEQDLYKSIWDTTQKNITPPLSPHVQHATVGNANAHDITGIPAYNLTPHAFARPVARPLTPIEEVLPVTPIRYVDYTPKFINDESLYTRSVTPHNNFTPTPPVTPVRRIRYTSDEYSLDEYSLDEFMPTSAYAGSTSSRSATPIRSTTPVRSATPINYFTPAPLVAPVHNTESIFTRSVMPAPHAAPIKFTMPTPLEFIKPFAAVQDNALVHYGPITKKKVNVPNSFTHRIVYFTDNYGVEWRPISKTNVSAGNIAELVQQNIVFCHHKITKELFKLLICNQTLFLAVDHSVYYFNAVTNNIELYKNKHNKNDINVVKWISAIKKNNTYVQGYLNRDIICTVTRENYKTLSIQNYVLF